MTPFHIHSDYSLLHSTIRIKDLTKKAKEYGFNALAITELDNMFSAIEFYESCRANEIKPIIGSDVSVIRDGNIHRLILIAKNKTGYDNLMYLSSISYLYNMRGDKPYLPFEEIVKNKEGLCFILPILESETGFHLNIFNENNILKGAAGYEKAKEILEIYRQNLNEVYLEITRDSKEERLIEDDLIKLSNETGTPLLASSNIFFLNKLDYIYKDALECIENNKQFDDLHRRPKVKENYFRSKEEFEEIFKDLPEAVENTDKLAESINLEIPLGNPTPPTFKFTKDYAAEEGLDIDNDVEYFEYKCKEGLEERLKHIPENLHEEYRKRLDYEIDIIKRMKFPGYMLIVWDFVREAKKRKIPVGPGRGSAAGALVAYSLQITNIDPLRYGLLFERFLNPERVSMPDIDMDFCQERRGEIIEYVREKYGKVNVAQVITFGSLLAKGVLRDVARIFGIDYSEADRFVKLIPDQLGITLEKAKELEPKIVEITEEDPLYNRLYSFGEHLEGLKRNTGMHAAGVVISDEELWKKSPLYRQDEHDDTIVTQYSLNYLEPVDLIKFDFLGLKTLTVIDRAVKNVKFNKNEDINIDLLTLDDPKVFELIQSGHTLGLFQIESDGMQDLAKRLKPTNFEDIIAMLALYRPGPMDSGMLDDYIDRKHGRKPVSYFFDEFEEVLKPILEPTYGVIVYQEQVMQIVQAIGGFSLGESDIIRRAMGKKKFDLMKKYAEEFAQRAQQRGFSYDNAKSLFELIEKFAGYGFNKSHSAAYAMITYQTAYLKTYYPTEFLSALLTYEAENTDKIAKYIEEAKVLGIEVLPPNVNKSNAEFTPIEDKILFGLSAIKGVGSKAIESIVANRPYESLEDFILKVDTSKVNKKVLEQLIKAGAMDDFGLSRKAMLSRVEEILEFKKRVEEKKNAINHEHSLFADMEENEEIDEHLDIPNTVEFDIKTLLEYEYQTLGFYVSAHPLDPYKDRMKGINYNLSSEVEEIISQEALFVGKIDAMKVRISKKGNKFAIATLMDFHGKIDVMIFERDLEKLNEFNLDEPIAIKAQVDKVGEFLRVTCRKLMTLEEAKEEKGAVKDEITVIQRQIGENYEEDLLKIHSELTKNPGNKRAVLLLTTPFGFSLRINTNIRTSL
ncbi:DNA polymerase III alpha subunit [Nautilia profundicola AmH]|uniref:DNA polymerase III subunit alpha n=1 Tax=Nautilia profundicola (strain ATCC BAA-1463 / DSM 18972 / AmH) TaxID=598659 RepID=B9L5T8_NAUPA|nr:DNA polymerase III subunit alpha [Nautilia profundicola]ACM92078.1 DNA polymerase III alpha subunit [Nautilia profundicola AmH]